MNNRLFHRDCKVTCYRAQPGTPGGFVNSHPDFFEPLPNAVEITKLRVQFQIEKHIDESPNTCDITITNLSESTRTNVQKKPLIVRIDAGYQDNLRHLYTGDLRWSFSKRETTDWETLMQLGDGDRAYRYARVNRSFPAGTNVLTVLQECAKSFGLELDKTITTSPDLQRQFASGRVLTGATRDELTTLLAPFNYRWSFQDGRMQILRDEETRADQAILVSKENGMINVPSYAPPSKPGEPPTLTVKMLLYPQLTPGGTIKVESKSLDGIFRVERVTHTGDTHGEDWTSEIEAKPI